MTLAALILILVGLGCSWIAITEFNIAAGLLGAVALLVGIDAAWFSWVLWRERRALNKARSP